MLLLDSYGLNRNDTPFRRNDVIIWTYDGADGHRWVWPPVVVLSEPLKIPRSQSVIQLVRGRVDLAKRSIEDVATSLRATGVAGRLNDSRWVRSVALQKALLGIWNLNDAN